MAIDATSVARARVAARIATASALLVAACAASPPTPDLAGFLERRAACDHFRGEVPDPPDAQRLREVMQQIDATCTGSDAQLAALKQRYRADPAVMKQLAQFEDHIER
jgi:hypothetical protein